MKFFLLFISVSSLSWAKIKVVSHNYQKITLESNQCTDLYQNYEALKKWNYDNKKKFSSTSCTCEKDKCSLDVTDAVPKHVLYLTGRKTHYPGPNCFNTAFNDQKILNSRRITTEHAAKFFTDSPLCKKITKDQRIQPGDLYIIYDDSRLPLHAFTYISQDLVFSKGGPAQHIPYKIDSFDWMFRNYKVKQECYHVNAPGKCAKYGMAFRCQSLQSYRLKNPPSKETQKVMDQLAGISNTVELHLLENGKGLLNTKALNKELQSMRIPLIEQKDNPNFSETEKFYWKMIWFKFIGLDRQMKEMI